MTREDECLPFEEFMADLALGTISAEDEQRLCAHLEGCIPCRQALPEFRAAGVAMAVSNAVEAPPALRDRLMHSLKEQQSGAFVELGPGVRIAYVGNLAWERTAIAGVARKLISRDKEAGTYTSLVHMARGTSYPPHRHAGIEQLFMLSGTLSLAGRTIGRGDFCIARTGTVHSEIQALDDSEFLVMASQYDEILADETLIQDRQR